MKITPGYVLPVIDDFQLQIQSTMELITRPCKHKGHKRVLMEIGGGWTSYVEELPDVIDFRMTAMEGKAACASDTTGS